MWRISSDNPKPSVRLLPFSRFPTVSLSLLFLSHPGCSALLGNGVVGATRFQTGDEQFSTPERDAVYIVGSLNKLDVVVQGAGKSTQSPISFYDCGGSPKPA